VPQGTSPIYNLLPDILSNLSAEPGLGKQRFQAIMQQVSGATSGRGGEACTPLVAMLVISYQCCRHDAPLKPRTTYQNIGC
jgi:hypothetical protein